MTRFPALQQEHDERPGGLRPADRDEESEDEEVQPSRTTAAAWVDEDDELEEE